MNGITPTAETTGLIAAGNARGAGQGGELPIVIVGAGQAGARAAAALRERGCTAPVWLCGTEVHAPYERPPLSKAALAGDLPEGGMDVLPLAHYAGSGITLRLNDTVVALDAAARSLRFASGLTQRFSACLLATGGHARELPALPRGTPQVHYLRTRDDVEALRAAMAAPGGDVAGAGVAVLGGGFLGLEIASTLRAAGRAVTLVEGAPRLLPRALPAPASDWLAGQVRAAGVDLRLGQAVESVDASAGRVGLRFTTGERLTASHLVIAIGLVPEVSLAAAAGLHLHPANGGIRIDANGATSAAHVYAAGDCTSQFHPFFGQELRQESWQNANQQAAAAAAAMAGQTPPVPDVPWFWTDQFGWNIQVYGVCEPGLDYVLRGEAPLPGTAARFLLVGAREGVLRHAVAVNAGGDLRQLKALFAAQRPCDADALGDTAQPLKALVRTLLQAQAVLQPA